MESSESVRASSVGSRNKDINRQNVTTKNKDIPVVDMNDPISPYIAGYKKGQISAQELIEKIDDEIEKQKEREKQDKLKNTIDILINNYEALKTKDFTNIENMRNLSENLKEMINDGDVR